MLQDLRASGDVGLLLWRTQVRIFLNQTIRSKNPGRVALSIVGGLLVLLAWSWEGLVTVLVVAASHRVSVRLELVPLLSLGFAAYTAVLVFSSLVFSLNALLLNPDLDLLLVAPRSVESVLGGRMLVQIIRLMLLGLLFTLPALLVLAVANHDPLIPIAFAVLYLLYPIYVVVIVSLLSLLLVRVIPPGRGREILALLGVVLALGINAVNFLVNPALRGPGPGRGRFFRPTALSIPDITSPWLPSTWAGRAAAAILTGDWLVAAEWTALLLLVSTVLFALGAVLSGRLYLAGWIQAVNPRRRGQAGGKAGRGRRRVPILGAVEAAIVLKDWRMRTRDVAQLVRFAMPAVFLVVIFAVRFPELPGAAQRLGQGPIAAMFGLIPGWILLFSLTLSLGLSAVSLEGKSIWIYAASPNSTLDLLKAKCWSTALPIAVIVTLLTGAVEVLIQPGWPWAVTVVVIAAVLSGAASAVMVGLGAVFARFDWSDARRMINPVAVFAGMALFGGLTAVTGVLAGIAVALAGATGLPLFTTWLAAMLIAIGATVAVAALSLLFGNERLRGLELG